IAARGQAGGGLREFSQAATQGSVLPASPQADRSPEAVHQVRAMREAPQLAGDRLLAVQAGGQMKLDFTIHRICNQDEFVHDLLLEAISYGCYLQRNLELRQTIIAR